MKLQQECCVSVSVGALVARCRLLRLSCYAAGPAMVAGPGADPACFKPLTAETKFFQWPAKPGPYRIALANGFIANDWRVQMIKVAKAYAEPAGRRRGHQGVQGRLGRSGRRGADRRGEQLHRPGL